MAEGRQLLASGNLPGALNAFRNARRNRRTRELCLCIAEAMARASNAAQLAGEIIVELEEYRKEYDRQMTPEQLLWLARAYADTGNKNLGCAFYYRAGDIYYDRKDYQNADACYQESLDRLSTYKNPFRTGYAYYVSHEPLDEAGHRRYLKYYGYAIRDGSADAFTYANMGYHHIQLGEYGDFFG